MVTELDHRVYNHFLANAQRLTDCVLSARTCRSRYHYDVIATAVQLGWRDRPAC